MRKSARGKRSKYVMKSDNIILLQKNALKIDQFIEIIRNFTHYQIGEKMMDFLDFFTSISKHGLKDPASHTSGAIFSYE